MNSPWILYVTTWYSEKELRDIWFTCVKVSRKNVEKTTKGKPMNKFRTFSMVYEKKKRSFSGIEHYIENMDENNRYKNPHTINCCCCWIFFLIYSWKSTTIIPPSSCSLLSPPESVYLTVFALEYNMLTYVGLYVHWLRGGWICIFFMYMRKVES